jgi:hypothetical protein
VWLARPWPPAGPCSPAAAAPAPPVRQQISPRHHGSPSALPAQPEKPRPGLFLQVLRIRWIRTFLCLMDPDPDPLIRGMDPNPDPSIITPKQ